MKYLIVKAHHGAGLGDLIRSAIAGATYAWLTNRILYIDWRGGIYGSPLDCNLFYQIFDLCDIPAIRIPPHDGSVHPPCWIGSLDRSFTQLYDEEGIGNWNRKLALKWFSCDLSRLDYPEEILVIWEFDQFSKMRNPQYERLGIPISLPQNYVEGLMWKRHFRLTPAMETLVQNSWAEIPQDLPIVGVHVRLTEESVRQRRDIALKDYWKVLDDIQKRCGVGRLFLATDNQAVQELFNCIVQTIGHCPVGSHCQGMFKMNPQRVVHLFLVKQQIILQKGRRSTEKTAVGVSQILVQIAEQIERFPLQHRSEDGGDIGNEQSPRNLNDHLCLADHCGMFQYMPNNLHFSISFSQRCIKVLPQKREKFNRWSRFSNRSGNGFKIGKIRSRVFAENNTGHFADLDPFS
jgi:hypothetical protein